MEVDVVTMADVARRAGVSVTTVSHVVNGTRHVAPATISLVNKVMAETGYRPNLAARALATSSTTTIGLALSIATNPYFGELTRSLEDRLRHAGFSLVLANTNDDATQALDVIDDLQSRQVSGLIVVPIDGNPAFAEMLHRLAEAQFPIALLDRPSALPIDQVYSGGHEAIFELTQHLARLGHQRIAYVHGTDESSSGRDRFEGFRAAVQAYHLDDSPRLVLEGRSDEHIAQTTVQHHLSAPDPCSAMVVSNNQMAIGALRAIRDLGLRVPQDVALVAFDDFEGADLLGPGITVAKQNVDALATGVVRAILQRVKRADRQPSTVVVPTTFVHRGSCGCAPPRVS
ncbi:MAG: LacI family DNA-binding transcriptional regulator [Arachnia sp.]